MPIRPTTQPAQTSSFRKEFERAAVLQPRDFRVALVGLVASLGLVGLAHAGELDAVVDEVIQPVSLAVSNSKPAAVYTVSKLENTGNATLTRVRFVATIEVRDESGGVLTDTDARFNRSSAYGCVSTNTAGTAIECAIGSLAPKPAPQALPFSLIFDSPTVPATGPLPKFLVLKWQAVFDQGSVPGNSNGASGERAITLAPIDPNSVASEVPAGLDLTLFTGTGVATSADNWVTQVVVPGNGSGTSKAAISETVVAGGCAGNLTTCSTSQLSIPGTFSTTVLKIFLIRDASTIAKGAKIGSARIYYTNPTVPDNRISYLPPGYEVLPCTDTTWGVLPQAGIPCIKSRFEYPTPKKGPKGAPADENAGDWRFEIWANDNGRYTQ